MYPTRGKIRKVVLLRPGALGDVLAARGVIRLLKGAFPGVEAVLVAPGERGAFLRREGWADRWYDWERAAFLWLFSDGAAPPPPALTPVFAGSDVVLAYVEPDRDGGWEPLESRLAALAPAAGRVFCPSRPPPGHEEGIGQWLARAAAAFCLRYNLLPDGPVDLDGLAAARIAIQPAGAAPGGRRYAVMHPGSGGHAKNWPLDNFIGLGRRLLEGGDPGGGKGIRRIVVTSGEADGDLGERLAASLPSAFHLHSPALETLAGVLAGAELYIGNDSGVTHLASSVTDASGHYPEVFAVFGPSDARVWAPPGARVLQAGANMDELSAEDAWRRIDAVSGLA